MTYAEDIVTFFQLHLKMIFFFKKVVFFFNKQLHIHTKKKIIFSLK